MKSPTPKVNRLAFYCLYGGYLLNYFTLKHPKIERGLWDWIKCELFYIGGACQHSGNCCQGIMLYDSGKAITDPNTFDFIKRTRHQYSQFIPVEQGGEISCFNCSWLTPKNTCAQYEKRPQLCKNYPMNYFISHDKVLAGCGYRVLPKAGHPIVKFGPLSKKIDQVFLNSTKEQRNT